METSPSETYQLLIKEEAKTENYVQLEFLQKEGELFFHVGPVKVTKKELTEIAPRKFRRVIFADEESFVLNNSPKIAKTGRWS